MIVAWMAYAVLLTAFLAVGAALLEKAFHMTGKPSRRVWALALVSGVVIPEAVLVLGAGGEGSGGGGLAPALEPVVAWASVLVPVLFEVEQPVLGAWLGVSVLLALVVAGAAYRVHRGRRRWDSATVDGVAVRLSDDVGPGVVGLLRTEIVLPRWVLDCELPLRRLILTHEREHLRHGDQRLLALGLLTTVLMPWNPVIWWMAHRLRRAVEMDCDARVLRSPDSDVRTYGRLLLEVGRRRGRDPGLMAAFSRPRSLLEARIQRMTSRQEIGLGPRAGSLALAASLVLLSAAFIPRPPATLDTYVRAYSYSCDVKASPPPGQDRVAGTAHGEELSPL